MQLANFMNEIQPIGLDALAARLAHREGFSALEPQIRAWHARAATGFWFSTENFTSFVYGTVVARARARLRTSTVATADFVRGVLLHFACREAPPGTHVLLAGRLRPSDMAFVDFPKRSADFVFCRYGDAAYDEGAVDVPALGNLLFDTNPENLAAMLAPSSIATLFFDMSGDAVNDMALLHGVAPFLATDATFIAQGPAERLHALFSRLTQAGAAKMWAQCQAADADTGGKTTFAYFELLNREALRAPRAESRHVAPTARRVDPPEPASPGPYRYTDGLHVHEHADETFTFQEARTVPFRAPLFVHGAENADTVWMGQFGRTAKDWLYLPDIACPPLRCSRFSDLRIIGTEACVTARGEAFPASQMPMEQERFVGWAPVYRSDMRAVAGGVASDRACTIGQRLSAPTVILANGGLPMHYHFLFDMLPRLWFLQQNVFEGYRVALPDTVRPYQVEALTAYYGIDREAIDIFSTTGPACLFEQAVAAPSMVTDWWAMPETIVAPRSALQHAVPPRDARFRDARRLYVSRRNMADSRGLVNESELVDRLVALGFTEVFPSEFSYDQEMHLFNQAEIVVGPFGSGMANLMFCAPRARVVLLQPDSTNWRILSFVMHELDLDYGYIFGESFRRRSRGHNTEWIIDADAVIAHVKTLL